ncbi:MAG: transcriptional repressor [Methylacidiphilales bacterium]|nr:transcriptional repressor [Candidatus Methylacidiphilales bacterium]MDW8349919.1 transcriptional repressor [Verrucomicrobiae bacterium]
MRSSSKGSSAVLPKDTHSSPVLAPKPEAIAWLQHHGYRVTQARVIMIQILLASARPITLASLEGTASSLTSINFTTAYRFLRDLESRRLLQMHVWKDGQTRYELRTGARHAGCSEHDHHHYVICNVCQTTHPIPSTQGIEDLQRKIETELGFSSLAHVLEFFGTCRDCSSRTKTNVQKLNKKTKKSTARLR